MVLPLMRTAQWTVILGQWGGGGGVGTRPRYLIVGGWGEDTTLVPFAAPHTLSHTNVRRTHTSGTRPALLSPAFRGRSQTSALRYATSVRQGNWFSVGIGPVPTATQ